jgi:hypothetical protein
LRDLPAVFGCEPDGGRFVGGDSRGVGLLFDEVEPLLDLGGVVTKQVQIFGALARGAIVEFVTYKPAESTKRFYRD